MNNLSNRKSRFCQIFIPFLTYCLLSFSTVSAEIQWNTNSIKRVYHSVGGFYCYAPSVVLDGNVERYWCCRNSQADVIRDYIYYFEGNGGKITTCRLALGHGNATAWDSYHVCDPSVVSGKFLMNGRSYRYALFYLGNNINESLNNQIGVAFSNDLTNNWIRYSNPIVAWRPRGQWGAGQPSVVSRDGLGRLFLFYTKGAQRTQGCVREIDFSDMAHPIVGREKVLPVAGLTKINGGQDCLNNFDVVYDSSRDRFLAVREQHPYPSTMPRFISTSLQIDSIPVKDLFKGRWTVEAEINPQLTGLPRNHNAGFERTLSGNLPNANRVRVVFSSSCAEPECDMKNVLWSYSLWKIDGEILDKTKKKLPRRSAFEP